MVAIFLLSVISVPLYYVLKNASHKRALVACKDFVKNESNKVFKILEQDLTQARRESFSRPSEDVYEIKVRKSDEDEDASLRYLYIAPDLKRQFDGKEWTVSRAVYEFDIATSPDAPGRLVVSLKTRAHFDGVKESDAPVLSQEKMIVMREDAAYEKDKHWREVGDVNKFFATQGSIMAGVKEDAKKLVQDFTGEWKDALDDVNNMTVGELKNLKDDLFGGLEEVKDSMTGIDEDILDLDTMAMFDPNCLGNVSDSKKKRAKAVKEALAAMKNKGEMDWEKVKELGGGSSFFSSGMKTDAIKQMYNAKMELFNAGQEIVNQIDDFATTAGQKGLDVDTSSIDRNKWGL
jgi:hypothetical protein